MICHVLIKYKLIIAPHCQCYWFIRKCIIVISIKAKRHLFIYITFGFVYT